jgi:DNA polymerase-3 subunit gamma/tau
MTTTLMQQQAQLVSLQENAAYISLKSEPLMRIAKGKQTELESALQQVCQRQIRVHLQVGNSQPTPTASQKSEVRSQNFTPSPPAPPSPSPRPPSAPSSPSSPSSQTPPSPSPVTQPQTVTDEEFSTAIASFAKAFDGEIVDLDYPEDEGQNEVKSDDNLSILDASNSKKMETVTVSPALKDQPRIKGRPQVVEDEEDLEF